jgi:hypothetical protein
VSSPTMAWCYSLLTLNYSVAVGRHVPSAAKLGKRACTRRDDESGAQIGIIVHRCNGMRLRPRQASVCILPEPKRMLTSVVMQLAPPRG